MTLARSHAHGLASPSPLQHWLNALLCVFAELVHHVAALFGMRVRRRSGDWHTGEMPAALPPAAGDTQLEDDSTPPPPPSRGETARTPFGASRARIIIRAARPRIAAPARALAAIMRPNAALPAPA